MRSKTTILYADEIYIDNMKKLVLHNSRISNAAFLR